MGAGRALSSSGVSPLCDMLCQSCVSPLKDMLFNKNATGFAPQEHKPLFLFHLTAFISPYKMRAIKDAPQNTVLLGAVL